MKRELCFSHTNTELWKHSYQWQIQGTGPGLPIIFRPNWGLKGWKKFFLRPPSPHLSQGLGDHPHPSPPYLKVWICHCLWFKVEWCMMQCYFCQKTGVIPPYHDAHQFVIQQCREHVNDLKHALIVMRKISDEDELSFQLSMMYLLEEGALRFVNLPKVTMFIKLRRLQVMDWECHLGSLQSTLS